MQQLSFLNVDDDNDSGIIYDENDDNESYFSIDNQLFDPTITEDAQLAARIRDDEKKFFCENTVWAWHGEFARLIMATAMAHNTDYCLMLYDARSLFPHAIYSIKQIYNAKAQFQCDHCGHCWTSMRARCAFYISKPNEGGIVLLRLYAQQCQYCYTTVQPLWYFDEICRVMKNLAFVIFENFFPDSMPSIRWDMTHNGVEPIRRLIQRQGHMHRPHNSSLCEACQLGSCY